MTTKSNPKFVLKPKICIGISMDALSCSLLQVDLLQKKVLLRKEGMGAICSCTRNNGALLHGDETGIPILVFANLNLHNYTCVLKGLLSASKEIK